ncbi:sodium/calcium exchanger family protein [Mycobacteroides abscessus subsp. abscessus]|nr:sodium/calcium exchanger family protein [Mycobacteroides abscessus subsp. abscessus]
MGERQRADQQCPLVDLGRDQCRDGCGALAARGKGTAAIATLISSKVNQWTLLIGSLPLAHLAGGGGFSLVLDARQVEETLLTATQTMMGVALILALRFHRATAWALLALFVVQFPITSTHGRLILCGVYGVLAIAGLIVNRHHILATIRSPFHRSATLQLTVP